MALRDWRGARLRRARSQPLARSSSRLRAVPRGRGARALAGPRRTRRTSCSRTGKPRPDVVTPSDHLQTTYNLWLPGHQLANGRAPWLDPYSFNPRRRSGRTTPAGRSRSYSGRCTRCSGPSARGTRSRSCPTSEPAQRPPPGCVRCGCRSTRRSWAGSRSRSRRTARSRPPEDICSGRSRCCSRSRCGRSRPGVAGSRLRRSPPCRCPGRCTSRSAQSFSFSSTPSCADRAGRRGRRGGKRRCGLAVWLTEIRGTTRRVRPTVRAGRALLGGAARLRHAAPASRVRDVRLRRLARPLAAIAEARAPVAARTPGSRSCSGSTCSCPSCSRSARTRRWPPRALWNVVPGLGDTRVPSRFLAIAYLCLAALVAVCRRTRAVALRGARRYPARRARPACRRLPPDGRRRRNPVYARLGEAGCSSVPSTSPSCSRAASISITRSRRRASAGSATRRPRRLKRTRPTRALRSGKLDPTQTSACAGSSSSSAECLSA